MTAARPERLHLDRLATPIGDALLAVDDEGLLRALDWEGYEPRMRRLIRLHYGGPALEARPAPAEVRGPLAAYFAGDLAALARVAWRTAGTAFQRRVWTVLTQIPPGSTLSYAALAARIGAPKAVRAAGLANGANPVGVVVPCHWIIGSDGSLTGYGGGLERKHWLLRHEGAAFDDRQRKIR